MMDLNDFALFAVLVEEQGLAAAGRRLGLPRSTVSRRLSTLEARLGVALVRRSTRSFSVTDLGQDFYQYCRAMLSQAEAASDLIEQQKSEPQGVIRVACPSSMIQFQLAPMVADFMTRYPKAVVILESTHRRVDVLREGFDLAIRVRFEPIEDSGLTLRRFGSDEQHLVCAPGCLPQGPLRGPEALSGLPSLSWNPDQTRHFWTLSGPEGQEVQHQHHPRLITQDMAALLSSALAGVGIVQLPRAVAEPLLKSGRLVEALPGWKPRSGIIHALYPNRRGLLPVTRKFLEACAAHFAGDR
ncbi:LysR substrate-binding domain-containing protein [Falsigemmobacter intermedius]|uniref:LysR family transcriptional regulator n=1 Tax=Falsigemmobacter intermedius TaxID=1553448 RepID=A0A3S3V342_9RHOB|nr:LysR substrate-binding domain-containing protein [Falsigemmobacter intermedius]RWY40922.1 LysR family transcriptional regulator [Falsigemmobacter intermedius]